MYLSNLQQLKKSKVFHLCFAITFFTSGIVVNLVQCLLYFTVRPLSKYIYRKINWYLCATVYLQLVFLGDWWSGSTINIYIDKDDFNKYWGKEHAYCIMNHTYEIDWLIGWMVTDRIRLLGNCKAYAKKVIQYIPILGWAWKFSEFVFLERAFEKDRENINRQVTELADHPDPMWLLLFAEGTRFTIEKHKISENFAREKNLPELKHHLQPRTRGFLASLPPMKGKVPAIYDVLVSFREDSLTKPTISDLLHGKPITAHMYMRRIPFEDVPESDTDREKFLRDMFIRKDKLKDSFVRTGDFFALSGLPRVVPFTVKRTLHSLINTIIWAIMVVCPIMYYLVKLFFSGKFLYFAIGAGIIALFMILLYNTIGMSKISKGSSYGKSSVNMPSKT